MEEVKTFIREHDVNTICAMEAPNEIKRSPLLVTIDLVLKELADRQIKGYLSRGLDATAKNRIAMQMVDLLERVKKYPKLATSDPRHRKMSDQQKKFSLAKLSAQHRANEYVDTLGLLLQKKNETDREMNEQADIKR